MSSYKKHILIYLFLVVIAVFLLTYYGQLKADLTLLVSGTLIGIFYSLLPDIDTPSSKLRSLVSKVALATILCCLLYYLYQGDTRLVYIAVGIIFFLYVLWFSKHRQIFHSPLTGIFLALPCYLINPSFFVFAVSGFLSHLLIDGKLS